MKTGSVHSLTIHSCRHHDSNSGTPINQSTIQPTNHAINQLSKQASYRAHWPFCPGGSAGDGPWRWITHMASILLAATLTNAANTTLTLPFPLVSMQAPTPSRSSSSSSGSSSSTTSTATLIRGGQGISQPANVQLGTHQQIKDGVVSAIRSLGDLRGIRRVEQQDVHKATHHRHGTRLQG